MEVEDPTSDVAGSDLNRLALGLGIQPTQDRLEGSGRKVSIPSRSG